MGQIVGNVIGGGFMLLFIGFWSAITLAFDVMIGGAMVRQVAALRYPQVDGVVTHSKVRVEDHGDGTTYGVDVKYVYSVAGRDYQGDRYRYGEWNGAKRVAQRVVDSLPVDRKVRVYHHPADPSDAVLLAGLEGMDLFLVMFMAPFNVIMLGGWAAILSLFRARRSSTGGAKLVQRGRQVGVCLPTSSPLLAAAATVLGVSFVMTFVVGFGFGFNPPLLLMWIVWAAIVAAAMEVYRRCRGPIAAGRYDLLIDPVAGTLRVPPTQIRIPPTRERKNSISIPLSDILSVEVRQKTQRGSEGSRWTKHIPTIVYNDADGKSKEAELVEWADQKTAGRLVDWIRGQLDGSAKRQTL